MTDPRAVAAGAVFVVAIAAVVIRPRRLDESIAAALGALGMVALGVIDPQEAVATVLSQWSLFLFLAGLMLISGLADTAGFFDAAGALAAGAARGSGRLLLLAIFAAGAGITAFLSNDATALILTPVVYSVATRLRLNPIPYLFATTFVADTGSITLPVSNPVNILVAGRTGLSLGPYLGHLLPASLAAIAVNAALLLLLFRRQAARTFRVDWRAMLAQAVPDRRLFHLTCAGLFVVAASYLAGSALGLPLGAVAAGGAVLLVLLQLAVRGLRPTVLREHLSLSLLLYVAGLLVLVRGVEAVGLTTAVVGWLTTALRGPFEAVAAGALATAVGANLINNVPAVLVVLSGAGAGHLPGPVRLPFLLGTQVGADLGPNLTPVGSLSTMLWLVIVRRRGVELSTLQYLKLGAVVTPATLLVAVLCLGATFLR